MRALLALVLTLAPLPASEVVVELKTVDGEVLCTVHSRGANAAEILTEIARKTEREIVGLDAEMPKEALPVHLDERPLQYVVQTIAACAGQRAHVNISRIELEPDLARGDDPKAFRDQCFASYQRAIRAHPLSPLAAQGELVLGTLREADGDLHGADLHFRNLISNFKDSEQVPEALLRSGLIQERLGEWDQAREQFLALAGLNRKVNPFEARALLEVAHCMAELGDSRQALHVLETLKTRFPPKLSTERQSQLYVRARALLADIKRNPDSMKLAAAALAEADELGGNSEWDADAMELRAEVLARFDKNAESARAWLAYSQKCRGPEQLRAWVNAAQQSRLAGDALGVMFVQRLARGTRAESTIASLVEDARKEIGLPAGEADSLGGDGLAEARTLVEQEKCAKALLLLEPLYQRREERHSSGRLELVLLYARALAAEKGVDAAVSELRRNLDAFPDTASRKQLCATAGELYESAERYDDAVRAFGGQL